METCFESKLNRVMPNGTLRGVRGRGNYSIFLPTRLYKSDCHFHIDINYSMLKKHNNEKRTLKIYSVYKFENDLFIINYSIDEIVIFKITFVFYI